MNMKKGNNVVLKTAVASAMLVMAGAANAGIGTSNRTFALELFNGSTPTLTQPVLAPVSYQFGGPIAAGSTFYVYLGLSGGATFSAVPALTTFAGTAGDGTIINDGGSVGGTISAVAIAADSTYIRFKVVLAAGKSISTNSVFTFTPTVGIINANTALAATGGTITLTWVNNSTATTSTIPAGDLDTGGTHSGTVATSSQGITMTAAASSAFPFNSGGVAETAKIDLAASPISAKFTTPGATLSNANSLVLINLGALRAKSNSTVQADGTTGYTIATQVASLGYVVTAPAGFFTALSTGGTTLLSTTADCLQAWTGTTSATFTTAALAAAATSITVSGAATPATATNYYVCMSIPAAPTLALQTGTPTLTASLVHAGTAVDSSNSLASTALYALTSNGASKYVRNYVPAAVTGWTNFLRIINTGAITADVSAAVVDEATGVAGTAAKILTGLKAGAATTVNSTQIEAAIGAQTSSARPRLLITAPTNALEVQNFLFTPNGSFSVNQGTE